MRQHRSVRSRWAFGVVGVTTGAALTLTGCAATVATKAIGNCSPSYSVGQSGVGKVSVQQAGRGSAIPWGVYVDAKYKFGTQFVVAVYAGGTKIDNKNQSYEPHGRVNAARALKYSGKVLEISGTGKNGGNTIYFDSKCHIA
jgi:hypothetical protein